MCGGLEQVAKEEEEEEEETINTTNITVNIRQWGKGEMCVLPIPRPLQNSSDGRDGKMVKYQLKVLFS